ncbi:hypothetical protein [Brevundimonas viscosa]|uniref:Uncharacterized protein n=1 Tax=Brevundimonas viscosa TaxID=871741 RepID=A0A1I6SK86_9CAUL|nr:hypothetical protein [Brevundimonas viscosa]SFS77377.1 hypothetical protein SAMN05192570_2517 [Brevundimonas viscosa]
MGTPSDGWSPIQPEAEQDRRPATQVAPEAPGFSPPAPAVAPSTSARRSYAEAYESLTFTVVTRAQRDLTVTLAAQPVFDLARSAPVGRRIRRLVRHQGGERALLGLGRRTLDAVDLHRIDLLTLRQGLDLLRSAPAGSGLLPAYWRTVASSRGRFALLCTELQHARTPGSLMIEVLGGLEQAPPEAIAEAISHFETAAQGIVLHIAPDLAAARRLKNVGGCCLAIDFAGVEHEHARDWRGAAELIGVARASCGQVLLLNLRPDRGLAAYSAGATHAVFAGMDPLRV